MHSRPMSLGGIFKQELLAQSGPELAVETEGTLQILRSGRATFKLELPPIPGNGHNTAEQGQGILTLACSRTLVKHPLHVMWLGCMEYSQMHQPESCSKCCLVGCYNDLVMKKRGPSLCHSDLSETVRCTHRPGAAHPRLQRENMGPPSTLEHQPQDHY